jgi:NAD(P)-dependent dehydrogenase (short-subunit alcohol dehydrogenase family)
MSKLTRALVIGSSGGIGASLVQELSLSGRFSQVFAVSRNLPEEPVKGVNYQIIDSQHESKISEYCQKLSHPEEQFSLIICCIGSLSEKLVNGQSISPEKRLEDINPTQLQYYFQTNTVMPALWLKHVEPLLQGSISANLVFLSARVGSITDNLLGGWYGYRASKAALNMLLKTAQIEFQRRAKNVCIVSYHPGTVDTKLSKPFQSNVKPEKLFTAAFTAKQLLSQLDNCSAVKGPYFIDWDGKTIPW